MPVEEAPRIPVQNQKTPPKFNWKSALLLFLIGATLIFGGLATYYYIQLNKNTLTPETKTPKTTTISAKKATQKAEKPKETKDETEGWKSDTGNLNGVKFSLKYPPKFTVYRSYTMDTYFTNNEGEKRFYVVTNRKSQITNYEDGDVSLSVDIVDKLPSQEGVIFEGSTFAGLSAKRGAWDSQFIGSLKYYTNKQPDTPGKYFTFTCNFSPPTDTNLKNICESVASSFKFLPSP